MKEWIRRRGIRFLREWAVLIGVCVLATTSFRSAIADWNDVPTGSMEPTILVGDRIFVNKLAYDLKVPYTRIRLATWGQPERGDIVICYSPADGTRLVKRVVGVPGDVLAMEGNRLFVNGQPLSYSRMPDQDFADRLPAETVRQRDFFREDLTGHEHLVGLTPGINALRTFGPVTVPADSFFLMGDNRDRSGDSRYFGFVPRDAIAGQVLGVVASVDPERHFRPRFERFFRRLE